MADTKEFNRLINQSARQTSLGTAGARIMSFSGIDYKFVFHLPVTSNMNDKSHYKIEEIEDEIIEVENWKAGLARNPTANAEKIANIDELIASLKRYQYALANTKNGFVTHTPTGLQTMSFQIHTDKQPVRSLGHMWPKGFTSGPRMVAGSMIFTIIDEHPLIEIMDTMSSLNASLNDTISPSAAKNIQNEDLYFSEIFPAVAISDQIPPFHITIVAMNEGGSAVNINLFNVQFINDGTVLSIQDMLTENTFTFVAEDIDIMRTLDTRGVLKIPAINRHVTISSMLTAGPAAARRARRGLPF